MSEVTITREIPDWVGVEVDASGTQWFVVDPGAMYPRVLKMLGATETDQYWLEVARRCLIQAIRDAAGGGINVRILRDDAYRLDLHPAGLGADRGVVEFREHYTRIKGALAA